VNPPGGFRPLRTAEEILSQILDPPLHCTEDRRLSWPGMEAAGGRSTHSVLHRLSLSDVLLVCSGDGREGVVSASQGGSYPRRLRRSPVVRVPGERDDRGDRARVGRVFMAHRDAARSADQPHPAQLRRRHPVVVVVVVVSGAVERRRRVRRASAATRGLLRGGRRHGGGRRRPAPGVGMQ